jgi:hypothetical protein
MRPDAFHSFCDFINDAPYCLVGLPEPPLRELANLAGKLSVGTLVDKIYEYRSDHLSRRVHVISPRGDRGYAITILPEVLLPQSVVLNTHQENPEKQLFIVINDTHHMILSCFSGLAIQIEWRGPLGHLPLAVTDWIIEQGAPQLGYVKQDWIYQADGIGGMFLIGQKFREWKPLVLDVTGSSYSRGTLIQARAPHGGLNQQWLLQEPPFDYTFQCDVQPPNVRQLFTPGLVVPFTCRQIAIKSAQVTNLCIQLCKRENYRESKYSAFLRLAQYSGLPSQLFWQDDSGHLSNCENTVPHKKRSMHIIRSTSLSVL